MIPSSSSSSSSPLTPNFSNLRRQGRGGGGGGQEISDSRMKAAEMTFGANGRRRDIYEDESNHFLTSMQAEQLPSTSPPTLTVQWRSSLIGARPCRCVFLLRVTQSENVRASIIVNNLASRDELRCCVQLWSPWLLTGQLQ